MQQGDRTKLKLALTVIAILLAVPAWNFLAANAWEPFVKQKKRHHLPEPKQIEPLPPKVGPDDAPVKIDIYGTQQNTCHSAAFAAVRDMIQERYPNLVQLRFHDTSNPAAAQEAMSHKITCETGLLVDGRLVWKLPSGKLVTFTGAVGEHGWTMHDLMAALDLALKKKGIEPPKSPSGKAAKTAKRARSQAHQSDSGGSLMR